MQKIAVVLQFYSGLDIIVDSKHWEHYGSPAYYNFIRQLNLDKEVDYQIFFLSTKSSRRDIPKEIILDNLDKPINIIPYYSFFSRQSLFYSNKIDFLYNKMRQYYTVLRKSHSAEFYYIDRDNLLLTAFILLLTKKNTLTRLLGVTSSLYDHLTIKNNLFSKMVKWVFQHQNSYFVCTNDGSYAELTEKLIGKSKFYLLFNGVNKNIHNLYKVGRDNNKIRIVYLSRIEPNKGHYDFIKFISNFSLKENLEVVFIGGGSLQKECSELVNKLKINKIVHFYGRMSHKNVISELMKADLFCSLNYDGSFGNGVLEAAQLSLPIVTLLHPGCLTKKVYSFKVLKNNQNLQKELLIFFTDFIGSHNLRKSMSNNSFNFSQCYLVSWEDRILEEFKFMRKIRT
jgi:glycosyltransferase involved in cell wall biosynthesis